MQIFRFMLAVLIGASLAVTPVAVVMIGPAAAMEHCDKHDNGDGACCEKSGACRPDTCANKCLKILGDLALVVTPFVPTSEVLAFPAADNVALRSWPPPSPPPRA